MASQEVNFDGLVGPTHHYAGLSFGNVASMGSTGQVARPRQAALEGLAKMKAVRDLGLVQGVIPPHPRPHLATLRALGFEADTPDGIIARAFEHDEQLVSAASSASAMWVANAATVSPAPDTRDGRVHMTPANLQAKLHRSIEPDVTAAILRGIFPEGPYFAHHAPLPNHHRFGDEGAANHTRIALGHGDEGVEVFTYGHDPRQPEGLAPQRFPARQTLESSDLIARSHGLDRARTIFVQQRPDIIDAGVFHNDVIAVGNGHVLLIHEEAWVEQATVLDELNDLLHGNLCTILVESADVPVLDAVQSYLFNSQIVTRPDGNMTLISAMECKNNKVVAAHIDAIVKSAANPIDEVRYFDLTQSMRNGGGPACLRLRVVLDDQALGAVNPRCLLTDELYDELCDWVERRYRETLRHEDLAKPGFFAEVQDALIELAGILSLDPAIYTQI
jgi:succinylarginine dihydrolase